MEYNNKNRVKLNDFIEFDTLAGKAEGTITNIDFFKNGKIKSVDAEVVIYWTLYNQHCTHNYEFPWNKRRIKEFRVRINGIPLA